MSQPAPISAIYRTNRHRCPVITVRTMLVRVTLHPPKGASTIYSSWHYVLRMITTMGSCSTSSANSLRHQPLKTGQEFEYVRCTVCGSNPGRPSLVTCCHFNIPGILHCRRTNGWFATCLITLNNTVWPSCPTRNMYRTSRASLRVMAMIDSAWIRVESAPVTPFEKGFKPYRFPSNKSPILAGSQFPARSGTSSANYY